MFCVQGYTEIWNTTYYPYKGKQYTMGQRLYCVLQEPPWYNNSPWILVLVIVFGLQFIALLVWVMAIKSGQRPFLQQFTNLREYF